MSEKIVINFCGVKITLESTGETAPVTIEPVSQKERPERPGIFKAKQHEKARQSKQPEKVEAKPEPSEPLKGLTEEEMKFVNWVNGKTAEEIRDTLINSEFSENLINRVYGEELLDRMIEQGYLYQDGEVLKSGKRDG